MILVRQEIGDVLRDYRLQKGQTLRQVASRASVALGYLSEVERGQKEASSEILASVAEALDVPISRIMREVGDRISVIEGIQTFPDVVPDELVAQVEAFLRARWPEPDPNVALVGRIVADLLHDRTTTRVDDVTTRFAIPSRRLQRLFARYVGVSPKWVLRRYRLQEAAARLAEEHDRPWAEVAAELGYFDQSHFSRDFTAAIGMTPAAYARACHRREAPIAT